MCGIAGVILSEPGPVGQQLVQMLDGCQHRGPDSTGFAIYRERNGAALVLRVHLGERAHSEEASSITSRILAILEDHGCHALDIGLQQEHLRIVLDCPDLHDKVEIGAYPDHYDGVEIGAYPGDVKALCYAIENNAGVEIMSIGNRLEIIKGVGSSLAVDRSYGISSYRGTHGIGHVRLATESIVDVSRAHPFWAYGFNDVAIVHNGQITNYHKMKRRLEKRGYQFRTDNDSELIAVYLADKLASGKDLEQALQESIHELDGTFSFLVSTSEGIGFAKDPLGAKPMVVLEKDGAIAVASEEVSLQRLFPGEILSTYEPLPRTYNTWYASTPTAKV